MNKKDVLSISDINRLKKRLRIDYFIFCVVVVTVVVINMKTKVLYFSNEQLLVQDISYFSFKDFVIIFFKNIIVSIVCCGLSWHVSRTLFYFVWLLNATVFGIMLSCLDIPVNIFLIPVIFLELFALMRARNLFLLRKQHYQYLMHIVFILFVAAVYECFVFVKLAEVWRLTALTT